VKDAFTPAATRRTLYAYLDRLNVPGLYRTFDFPSPDATSPQRDLTTVPQQALFLMNNPFTIECAKRILVRPEIAEVTDPQDRVGKLYQLLYGRPPTGEELTLASDYISAPSASNAGWERYVQALLEANEFVFVD
jgi:hypothetical protein